jgi:hypothetical protein
MHGNPELEPQVGYAFTASKNIEQQTNNQTNKQPNIRKNPKQ